MDASLPSKGEAGAMEPSFHVWRAGPPDRGRRGSFLSASSLRPLRPGGVRQAYAGGTFLHLPEKLAGGFPVPGGNGPAGSAEGAGAKVPALLWTGDPCHVRGLAGLLQRAGPQAVDCCFGGNGRSSGMREKGPDPRRRPRQPVFRTGFFPAAPSAERL